MCVVVCLCMQYVCMYVCMYDACMYVCVYCLYKYDRFRGMCTP